MHVYRDYGKQIGGGSDLRVMNVVASVLDVLFSVQRASEQIAILFNSMLYAKGFPIKIFLVSEMLISVKD